MKAHFAPWKVEDGRIYGVSDGSFGIPEGEKVLIVDTAPGNVALTEYDNEHTQLAVKLPEMVEFVRAYRWARASGDYTALDEQASTLITDLNL
jgi:hypothetical protein